jgi:hypothetical protein
LLCAGSISIQNVGKKILEHLRFLPCTVRGLARDPEDTLEGESALFPRGQFHARGPVSSY